MDILSQANVYKDLCEKSESMCNKPDGTDVGGGWVKKTAMVDKKSNCKVVLYEKNGQYALCFVGTSTKGIGMLKDWGANLKMGITGSSKQIKLAHNFTKDLKDKYGLTTENTVSIGHSEGGTEATYAGITNNFKTFTYNAYGIDEKYVEKGKNYDDLVINFRHPHDPVSKIRENVGTTYIVPDNTKGWKKISPFGMRKAHAISEMGDCTTAVPKEQYKKEHKVFVDTISSIHMTAENIQNMEREVFELLEPVIYERMKKGQIKPEAQLKRSGEVHVKAYYRDDGTYVEGYYRSLPDAA